MVVKNLPTITLKQETKLKLFNLANVKRLELGKLGISKDVSYDEIVSDLIKKNQMGDN